MTALKMPAKMEELALMETKTIPVTVGQGSGTLNLKTQQQYHAVELGTCWVGTDWVFGDGQATLWMGWCTGGC